MDWGTWLGIAADMLRSVAIIILALVMGYMWVVLNRHIKGE